LHDFLPTPSAVCMIHGCAQASVQFTAQLRVAKDLLQALHFVCLLVSAALLTSEAPAIGIITCALAASALPLLELMAVISVLMALMGQLLMLFSSASSQLSTVWSNMDFVFRNLLLGTASSLLAIICVWFRV
jgi:hypothetical protein